MMFYASFTSPLGEITVSSNGTAVVAVSFGSAPAKSDSCAIAQRAVQQLQEYFAGQREHFELPLQPRGTEFQQRVWQALLGIPYGDTASYKYIATQLGNVKAVRAVGMANSRNPIAIIVPCHRVIGADGSLTGYAGGLDKKQWLLDYEGV